MALSATSLAARIRDKWMATVPTKQFDQTWINRLCDAIASAVVDELHANGTVVDVAKKGTETQTSLVIR